MLARALSVPFRTTAIAVVVFFTLVARFCQLVSMPNAPDIKTLLVLPLWYTSLGMLGLYGKRWIVHVSRGLADHPLVNETDVTPFMTLAPARLVLVFVVVATFWILHGSEPSFWVVGVGLLATYVWIGATLEDSFFRGLHPVNIWYATIGGSYVFPAIVATAGGGILLLMYVVVWVPNVLALAGAAIVFVLTQSVAGLLLFSRRNDMGLVTEWSPEQSVATEAMAEAQSVNELLENLDAMCSRGEFGDAYRKLEAFMGENVERMDPVMHERLASFGYQHLFLEHAVHYIHRLAAAGERRKAWAVLKECLLKDEKFHPMDGDTLLELTKAAAKEDAGFVDMVLEDFPSSYPDCDAVPDAMFRRSRVLTELLNRQQAGSELLQELLGQFPDYQPAKDYFRSQRH